MKKRVAKKKPKTEETFWAVMDNAQGWFCWNLADGTKLGRLCCREMAEKLAKLAVQNLPDKCPPRVVKLKVVG
jgi:hypothetical protein